MPVCHGGKGRVEQDTGKGNGAGHGEGRGEGEEGREINQGS